MNPERILGLGMDLVEIDRIEESFNRYGDRFLQKIFHPAEIEYARSQSRPAVHSPPDLPQRKPLPKLLARELDNPCLG